VRALDRDVRALLEQRITALAQQQAASFGCTAEVDYARAIAVLVNTPRGNRFRARGGAGTGWAPRRVTLQARP
jgi:hippurate hydrolase